MGVAGRTRQRLGLRPASVRLVRPLSFHTVGKRQRTGAVQKLGPAGPH
jgi:hypothetical protein